MRLLEKFRCGIKFGHLTFSSLTKSKVFSCTIKSFGINKNAYRSSSILGTGEKDVLTSISPDGTVILSKRIQATLFCWMNLQKFPFDVQYCHANFESCKCFTSNDSFLNLKSFLGMHNASDITLHWEEAFPLQVAPELHLTEYVLVNHWTNESLVNASINDLRHGAFSKKIQHLFIFLNYFKRRLFRTKN